MYEYLVENLISYSQVDGNLRRTADRGLVSELYRRQMNALALKYFGVDSNGNYTENKEDIVAYRCPYSGEIISDLSTAHLEHILPVSSNGGTVLFNCIPILDKVNLSKRDEANLLVWWQEQNYFNYDRLERLIQYMLEAYTLAFKEPTEEELYDYDNSLNSDDYIENDDLSIDLKDKTSNQTNINIQQTITYYQLINDLINELSKNRDVSKYNSQLNSLKEQNTFGNIDELEKVINAVQAVFKEILGESSKSYLSYSLKIDMNKLLRSLDKTNYEQEIRERIYYIKQILNEIGISFLDYLKNMQDIKDIDLIYIDINTVTENQKKNFIENIQIGHDTKIIIFINMLKMAKEENEISELLSNNCMKKFTTYRQNENGQWVVNKEYNEIGQFWSVNKNIIMSIIKNNYDLRNISEKLDNYYLNTLGGQHSMEGQKRRLEIFIDMLKRASENEISELLKNKSNQKFRTYKQDDNGQWIVDKEYNEIGQFWVNNREKIIELINQDEELKNKLDNYYLNTLGGQQSEEGKKRRLEIFMDMLKKASSENEISELLKAKSSEKFKTYRQDENGQWIVDKEYNEIGQFWVNNREKIIELINQDEELKNKLDNYFFNTRSGQQSKEGFQRRIMLFVDMIKRTKSELQMSELLKHESKELFKRYRQEENGEWIIDKEYSKIGDFWPYNKDKIMELINQDEELKNKLDDYYMNTLSGQKSVDGLNRRIDIFIKMLKNVKTENEMSKLLKTKSEELFITYKKNEYGELIVDKEYGKIGYFWSSNKDKIMEIINQDEELKNKLDNYYFNTYSGQLSEEGKKRREKVFIDMLNISNYEADILELFKFNSKLHFKTYKKNKNGEWVVDKEYGEIGTYWSNNRDKAIIPKLFFSIEYSNEEYDIARQNIMNYLNLQRRRKQQPEFKTIDEYIDTLDKTKKDVKSLIELRDSLLLRKQQLSIENQELTEELNSSYRRAM
jgi:hypothetical protein